MKLMNLYFLFVLALFNSAYGVLSGCLNKGVTWKPHESAVDLDIRPDLYRIAVRGFRNLVVKYGDDPCMVLRTYCNNQSSEEECFDKIYPELLREILRFSGDMKYLKADERLFMRCRNSTLKHPEFNATIQSKLSTFNDSLDATREELLQILCISPEEKSLDSTIKLFDMRRNEIKMAPIQKLKLFQAAILIQPNSTYIINQLGLALLSMGESDLMKELFENAVERGLWPHALQRPEFNYVPGLVSKPWHNNQDFPFICKLEKGYKIIREELLNNLVERSHIFTGEQENHNVYTGGDWKALHIKSTPGLKSGYTKYANYFPRTVKMLKECNEDFLLVKFSSIKPGTHIKPHTGPSNTRLRIHLTLFHTGGAKIRVGSEWRTWNEGEGMIMDSSWEHEVIHNGNDNRIILILDIWHPDYQALA